MPRESVKKTIVNHLITNALTQITFAGEIFHDDEDETENVLDGLYEDLHAVMEYRRGVVFEVPKSIHWREDILSSMDENRFRQMLRVNCEQFAHLLPLISSDKVFTKCTGKQFPKDLQLAIVLFRLGSSGESASIAKIATFFGIGDGGTLLKITKRIFSAFLKLIHQYIFWPDAAERTEIVRETFSELPFCIGYVDGTEIKLAEAPVNIYVVISIIL